MEDLAAESEAKRDKKIKTIGNYVHDSVPVSNTEVGFPGNSSDYFDRN